MRNNYYRWEHPSEHPNQVTLAGEFHGRGHVQHADSRMNAQLLFIPLFLHFGVKGYTGAKFDMKKFVHLERWIFVFAMGIMKWLRMTYTEAAVTNPPSPNPTPNPSPNPSLNHNHKTNP